MVVPTHHIHGDRTSVAQLSRDYLSILNSEAAIPRMWLELLLLDREDAHYLE
jgi:hypothetical protein